MFSHDITQILLLASLGGLISLVGGIIILSVEKWRVFFSKYATSFAAGVLITIAILALLPEANHLIGEEANLVVLISFFASYIFENFFVELHHHQHHFENEEVENWSGSAILIVVGDSIHNFVDGVSIAASYLINPGLGLITAISTFLHEVPHEIGDFSILLNLGFSKKKVLFINFFSALTTIVGAVITYFLFSGSQFLGTALAITVGMFLYLGASDFLPKTSKKKEKLRSLLVLLLGALLIYFSLKIVPHSH